MAGPPARPLSFFLPLDHPAPGLPLSEPSAEENSRVGARDAATTAAGVEPQSASRTQKGFHPSSCIIRVPRSLT
ncbi:uncharacterized protein SCHCODRAFT_02620109 [Schizophyllum commune H4-8]|uniref:uncharacterized protein n=1 Tax=Schizophyllum commune (strain H4-8 / FGSC 9210) TaxID=578458 RepID=UPI0021606EE9|nr:uncharacterized protein SCHCODRAFT_02620109 [Schizophyllum commune H4-8]KAI5895685.1 hypothetical protein SCHCODRAFT_02620109 [Schizophyllum commune H4-8]